MSLTVLSNIAALKAQRQIALTTDRLSTVQERLASGMRINSASDDAAGLAVADALRAQTRVASVAIRNANDGISAVAIADGALGEISSILNRMAELASQSANGAYRNTQRSPLQGEFAALASEIERIATVARFNNIALLSGGATITLQVGFDSSSFSRIVIGGIQGTLQSLQLADEGSSRITYSITANTEIDAQAAARTALAAVQAAIDTIGITRGSLGASESRLDSAVRNLQVTRENFVAAEAQIRDADVAQEAADLVRLQILQQAGIAVLTQANLQPSQVLKLLNIESEE